MKDLYKYIGNELQLSGVEELRLTSGKGAGMRLWDVRNGLGLQFSVCPDRCADILRLSFRGYNFGYLSFGGYVAPAYYDDRDRGWLKSFSAGFLTTCGIYTAGSPSNDEGEMLPLHGCISNTPADQICWKSDDDAISIRAVMREGRIFAHKLILERTISCSRKENMFTITDTVTNCGDKPSPVMMLYHNNIGYPLLDEHAEIYIPSYDITPADEHSREHLDEWRKIPAPVRGFRQQNYYHKLKKGRAGIFNPEIGKGLLMAFDTAVFKYFIQWKMMGERDYVLGLEPANCHPGGRVRTKENNDLLMLEPDGRAEFRIRYQMAEGVGEWRNLLSRD